MGVLQGQHRPYLFYKLTDEALDYIMKEVQSGWSLHYVLRDIKNGRIEFYKIQHAHPKAIAIKEFCNKRQAFNRKKFKDFSEGVDRLHYTQV